MRNSGKIYWKHSKSFEGKKVCGKLVFFIEISQKIGFLFRIFSDSFSGQLGTKFEKKIFKLFFENNLQIFFYFWDPGLNSGLEKVAENVQRYEA